MKNIDLSFLLIFLFLSNATCTQVHNDGNGNTQESLNPVKVDDLYSNAICAEVDDDSNGKAQESSNQFSVNEWIKLINRGDNGVWLLEEYSNWLTVTEDYELTISLRNYGDPSFIKVQIENQISNVPVIDAENHSEVVSINSYVSNCILEKYENIKTMYGMGHIYYSYEMNKDNQGVVYERSSYGSRYAITIEEKRYGIVTMLFWHEQESAIAENIKKRERTGIISKNGKINNMFCKVKSEKEELKREVFLSFQGNIYYEISIDKDFLNGHEKVSKSLIEDVVMCIEKALTEHYEQQK